MESLLKPLEELTYDQLRKAYRLHRDQCVQIADRLRSMTGEEEIISEFDSDLPKALEPYIVNCPVNRLKWESVGVCEHIFQQEKDGFRKCVKCGLVRP